MRLSLLMLAALAAFGPPARAIVLNPGDILVTDTTNGVFRIDPATGDRTVIASDTVGSGPSLGFPTGIARTTDGAIVFADVSPPNSRASVVRLDPATLVRTTVSDDTTGTGVQLLQPLGLVIDATGDVLQADDDQKGILKIDLTTGKWRNRKVGTDRKRAEREAALLEEKLREGTYQDVQQISWSVFVEDDVAKIRGAANRAKTKRALDRFGKLCRPAGPRRITFAMLESFVVKLEADDLEAATINFYLRYIRAGLNRAVKRQYAARNPFDTSLFLPEEDRPPRVISNDEESAIMEAADELYGLQWRAFVHVALNVGGRNYSELIPLGWDRVALDGDEAHVHLTNTKAHCDRIVPIHAETVCGP